MQAALLALLLAQPDAAHWRVTTGGWRRTAASTGRSTGCGWAWPGAPAAAASFATLIRMISGRAQREAWRQQVRRLSGNQRSEECRPILQKNGRSRRQPSAGAGRSLPGGRCHLRPRRGTNRWLGHLGRYSRWRRGSASGSGR